MIDNDQNVYICAICKKKLQHFKSQMTLRSADGEARLRSDFWISCETPNPPWLVVEVPAVVVVPDATISIAFWRDTMRVRNSRRPSLAGPPRNCCVPNSSVVHSAVRNNLTRSCT